MSQEPKVTRFGALPLIDSELATKLYVDNSSGGGGLGAPQFFVTKVTDLPVVNNSEVMVDDDELLFAALANKTYIGFMYFFCKGGTTPDIKVAFTLPAGASGIWLNGLWRAGTSLDGFVNAVTPDVHSTSVTNGNYLARFFKIVTVGTAGDCQIQLAQNVATVSDTVIDIGSQLIVWEVQ